MEQPMLWVTVIGIIVLPFLGWIINTLITKKIDDANEEIEKVSKELESAKESLDKALNGQRTSFETTLKEYVRKEMYDQAIELHRINNDEKFKSLLSIVTTQYTNLESKINENNINMNEKISGLKTLINEKFIGNKQGG